MSILPTHSNGFYNASTKDYHKSRMPSSRFVRNGIKLRKIQQAPILYFPSFRYPYLRLRLLKWISPDFGLIRDGDFPSYQHLLHFVESEFPLRCQSCGIIGGSLDLRIGKLMRWQCWTNVGHQHDHNKNQDDYPQKARLIVVETSLKIEAVYQLNSFNIIYLHHP